MKIPLPSDTLKVLNSEQKILLTSNFGLLFQKYVFNWQDNWHMEEKERKRFRERLTQWRKMGNIYLESVVKRRKALIKSLGLSNWHTISFQAITDSRLIVGLGGESVLETGITLHPLYGFPCIPASGLKGLARAYAEIAAGASREEIKEVFGSEDKTPTLASENIQGRVFFIDGIPEKFPELELDIMTPHYGKYYKGEKPPADYLEPEPITFLTVAHGTSFNLALYSRDTELLNKAKQWLIGGLTELGAGGKTNVGYGYFRIDESQIGIAKDSQALEEEKTISELRERVRSIKNKETFLDFLKNIKPDEVSELRELTFKGMESVINIGIVEDFLKAEVSGDIKKTIAEKMLHVIKPAKKWDEKKKARYEKLKALIK